MTEGTRDVREQVARIIDPDAWTWKPLPRDPNEGPASKKAFDAQDQRDEARMAARRSDTLAKADAILAYLKESVDAV